MECLERFQTSIDENIPLLNATHLKKEEIDEYRSCLSTVSFRNRLPVIVYLSVVAVVGFIGNALVIIVYWQSFKPSASRIFVLAMAIEDMTTSVIGLPLQIITIRYAYDTYSYWLCRGMFAAATFPTQTSGLILVAVALDRLYRIWFPQKKHITQRQCCVINIAIFFCAHVLFAFFIPMYGIHSYPSHIKGVSLKMCWSDDAYRFTSYPGAFGNTVNVLVFGGLTLMTTSYVLIGIKVWKRKTPMKKTSRVTTAPSLQSCCSSDTTIRSKHASKSTETDEPQENRESLATRGSADVQAASGSAHITVVEVNPVPYPLKSAMSTTKAALRNDKVHHPVEIVKKDTSQEQPHASENLRDEEKIKLNVKDKEDSGTSPRISPLESSLVDDHDQSILLVVASDANTSEESCIELGLLADDDDELVLNYYREIICSGSAPKPPPPPPMPLAKSPSNNIITTPVVKTTVSLHTRKIRSRTTLMMAVLTFFYIVNWVPHNVSRLVSKHPINWCPGYTECGANINAFGLRSYYLNSAVNAFVYSFCSTHFRNELGRMVERLYRRSSRMQGRF